MLKILKLLVLLGLTLIGTTAYPNLNLTNNALADDVPFRMNYANEDYAFGNELINAFTHLTKNKLDKKEVSLLLNLFKKSKSFDLIKDDLERMKKVSEITDQDSFFINCEIKNKKINEFTESINDRFNSTIDSYCRYLYLKRTTNFSANINLSTRDLNYFKDASPFFAMGEHQSELVALLKHFKPNTPEWDKLSNIFIEKLLEFKIRPSATVLSNLRINTKFSQFLQNNLNLDENSLSYFQEEFQRTIRESQEAIERGDFLLSKQLVQGAYNFYNKNKLFISDKRAYVGLIIAGKAFYLKGKEKEALETFEQARSIAPKEEFSDSNFHLIWPYIIDKDYKGLKKNIEKYSLIKDFDKFDSRLQYWLAFSELKLGDSKKATELFNRIVSNSPYSFYSIISLKELANISKTKTSEDEILAKLVSKEILTDYQVDKYSDQLKDSLKRFSIWSKIGNERFQTLEIRYIQNLSKENTFKLDPNSKPITAQAHKAFLTLNLVKLLNSKKRYVTSFKIFQDSIDQSSLSLNIALIKQVFPLSFFDIIKKNASTLDPLIVISLIRQESAFNPEANSGVGAKGLMQLMPMTAKRFNNRVKVKHLSNPEINVAIGTKYLRQLITRYDGNLIFALASYNAGESRIDKWRKDIFRNDDPLATIEAIPFEETRNYVKLIYRNYFFYNLIQNKSILKTPIEDSFKVATLNKRAAL